MRPLFLLALAVAASHVFGQDCTDPFQCVEYISNYDGDTLKVNLKGIHPLFGQKIPVRIKGIDTPEIKGKKPCEAQQALVSKNAVTEFLSKAKRIELKNLERDKYFRILADVVADGVDIATQLKKRGLAVEYDGGTKLKTNWCTDAKRTPADQKGD